MYLFKGVTHLRTDGVYCRESASTVTGNLKIVLNGCCLGRQVTMNNGHIESTGGNTWLPIRYCVVCRTGKNRRNIYKAQSNAVSEF